MLKQKSNYYLGSREVGYENIGKDSAFLRIFFDDDELVVTEETVAADVKDGDSLVQMQIVIAIEEMFGIKFSIDEVTEFKNIGDVIKAIDRHIG